MARTMILTLRVIDNSTTNTCVAQGGYGEANTYGGQAAERSHAFAEPLGGPPVTEVVRVDVGEPERDGKGKQALLSVCRVGRGGPAPPPGSGPGALTGGQ